MLKIVIVAGGTGGHVFPAECIAKELIHAGYNVDFIVDQRGKKYLTEPFQNITETVGTEIGHVQLIEQPICSSSKFCLLWGITKNFIKSIYYFLKERPACVIGFGGYPTFAPVVAAQVLGIRTIIHEQNAVLGRANSILMYRAKCILTAFERVIGALRTGNYYKKIRWIGNPTRFDDLYDSVTPPNNSVFTILVFGGSQGSSLFANVVAPAIANLNIPIRVFHQARPDDIEKVKNLYTKTNIDATVSCFFHNIGQLYQLADLVISRSGASTIFEIIGFKKPSILIPYANSVNGDQVANAKALGQSTIVLDENSITVNTLKQTIIELINNPDLLTNMVKNLPSKRKCNDAFLVAIHDVLTR